jgi:hypothetical protein
MKGSGHFERHFDWDGVGPFLQTNVAVTDLRGEDYVPEGYSAPFLLGLYAAYVGEKVEHGLAESAGLPTGLHWASTELTLPAVGDRASVDVARILDPIRGLLGIPNVPAERVAKLMMPKEKSDGFRGADIKLMGNEAFVSVGVDSLSFMGAYKPLQKLTRTGAVLSGVRAEAGSCDTGEQYRPLKVSVTVGAHHLWRGNDWLRIPELRPQVIAEMLDLNQRITAAYMAVA